MSVEIRLTGSKQLQAALRDMSGDLEAEVSKAVIGTALELRGDVVKSIKHGPASGRTYTHYFFTDSKGRLRQGRKRDKPHTASAPGQPPMSDGGRLANSITFDKVGQLEATVGSNVVYAVFLEYGTSRMAARPFLRPAVERIRDDFNRRLERAIERAT